MKQCCACLLDKPYTDFNKAAGNKDGFHSHCRLCYGAHRRARYVEKREIILAQERSRYAKNAEPYAKRAKAWREANKEKKKQKDAEYASANRARLTAVLKAWERANPEKVSAIARRAAIKHKEKNRERRRLYKLAHPERAKAYKSTRRARAVSSPGTHTASDILALGATQRGKCAHPWCRVKLGKKYHVDHIIALAIGGSNDRRNIQLLCVACNLRKGAKHPIDFALSNGVLV